MSQHINVIKFNQLLPILKDQIEHPSDMGVLGLIGAPGVGKTAIIRQAAKECGTDLSYVNAGNVTLGDLMGCAMPDKAFTNTVYLPPAELLNPDLPLFVDELTNFSDRGVACALSNLLLEGHIPGHKARYNKARFYACNPPAFSDLAEDIPRILVNRGPIYMVDYDYQDFINYALNAGAKRVHPFVAAFVQETKNKYLFVKDFTVGKKDGVSMPAPSSPYPTPRAMELFSDRLWRMERGLPTTAYDEAYACLGSESGKAAGDMYAVYQYLPRVSDILAGKRADFPTKAFQPGTDKVLGPLQMMAVFGILGSSEDAEQYTHGCEWLFDQLKKETVGRELLRTFSDASRTSIHKGYCTDVLNKLGSKAMGKEWVNFLVGSLRASKEAANF